VDAGPGSRGNSQKCRRRMNEGQPDTGAALGRRIRASTSGIAGVLLLATPLSIDLDPLFAALEPEVDDFPLFGGGAGDYIRADGPANRCGSRSRQRRKATWTSSARPASRQPCSRASTASRRWRSVLMCSDRLLAASAAL